LARRKAEYARDHKGSCFDKLPTNKVRDLKHGDDNYYGHGNAVNIIPNRTVELRLWKGTLKPETIKATIELSHYIVNYVKNNPVKKLRVLSWKDFIIGAESLDKYKFLPDYLVSHNLHSKATVPYNKIEEIA